MTGTAPDSPADPAPDANAGPIPAPPPSQGSTDEAAPAGDGPAAHDATDPDAIGGFTGAPAGMPELTGAPDDHGDDSDDLVPLPAVAETAEQETP